MSISRGRRPRRNQFPISAPAAALLAVIALMGGAAFGLVTANLGSPSATPRGTAPLVAGPSPRPSEYPSGSNEPAPSPPSSSSPSPTNTVEPTPVLVAAPLTGRPVTPAVAARHPIAVMVDDLGPARPQSGFNAASVVFQAPAEGGIPRYMMIFQDRIAASVGPVRSARYYYIAWAAQWRAMYVHVGGSPQAMQALATQGNGQLVYNADEFRWGGRYLWRVTERSPPHNVYTDGKHLRQLAKRVGALDQQLQPAWQFAPDRPLARRPVGGRISMAYPANRIQYDYDRNSNTYERSVTGSKHQIDAADNTQVAPKNVVIMLVHFGPLNDGHYAQKHRLEATVVGSGRAWIATNGRTIRGTWRKTSLTGPLQFFDGRGRPVTLTIGQTFVQVMPTGSLITVVDGKVPKAPSSGRGPVHRGPAPI